MTVDDRPEWEQKLSALMDPEGEEAKRRTAMRQAQQEARYAHLRGTETLTLRSVVREDAEPKSPTFVTVVRAEPHDE